MEMLKKGTPVKIKNTLLSGVVSRMKLSEDGEVVHYLVAYKDNEDVATERYFDFSQIEVVTEEADSTEGGPQS